MLHRLKRIDRFAQSGHPYMGEHEPLIGDPSIDSGYCAPGATIRSCTIVLLTSIGGGIAISAGVNLGTNFATGAPVLAAVVGATALALIAVLALAVFDHRWAHTAKADHWRSDAYLAGELIMVAGACEGFQLFFHNQFCGWLFRCGCVWQWQGGWKDCNVHNSAGRPKCPWCIARTYTSWTTDSLILALMVVAYAGANQFPCYPPQSAPWCRCRAAAWRLCFPIAVFFAAGFVVALVFSWASPDYPYFLVGPVHGNDSG
jgi:hypothetical protein